MKKKTETKDDVPIGGCTHYVQWYCPNCAQLITAYPSNSGQSEADCIRCGIHMVRTQISRRVIDIRTIM